MSQLDLVVRFHIFLKFVNCLDFHCLFNYTFIFQISIAILYKVLSNLFLVSLLDVSSFVIGTM